MMTKDNKGINLGLVIPTEERLNFCSFLHGNNICGKHQSHCFNYYVGMLGSCLESLRRIEIWPQNVVRMMKKSFFNTNKCYRKAIFHETQNDWKLALRENKALIIWINLIITLVKLPAVVAKGLFITSIGDQIQSLMGLKGSDCVAQRTKQSKFSCVNAILNLREQWFIREKCDLYHCFLIA